MREEVALFRNALLLCSLAFSMGVGIGSLPAKDFKRALLVGLIAAPASYAAASLAYYRRSPSPKPIDNASSGQRQIAVFWDYENVRASTQGIKAPLPESIVAYSQSQGRLRLKTVYANWRRENEFVVQTLYSLGFEPIHVSMGKPNSVDVKLTVDCLNAAHQYPEIEQFIIVTADKDFIPLVHALKAMGKTVTLIGRLETVSEQLLLSADEFVSLEQLLGDRTATVTCPKSCDRGGNTECDRPVSYTEAVDCLLAAINSAREQGKSTRFEVIDQLMRAYPGYDYHGASSVIKEDGSTFLNFSTFIAAAEADGKVQVHTLAGFKELFLIEEDPIAESEFSPQNADTIDSEQWLVIIDRIQQAFRDGRPGPTFGRFQVLFGYIRQAKKSGELPHSNGLLKKALIQLTEIGVLIEQEDGSFRLSDRWEEEKSSILERLTQMQLG